jgi:hypothetical protein
MNNRSEIQSARINTAGAYVWCDGLLLFVIGIRTHNGNIPVVRPGGHREEHETGWQCAVREVYEESGLQILPLPHQRTYLSEWEQLEFELQEIKWKQKNEQEPDPLLVVSHRSQDQIHLSLMYLAYAEGIPAPSSEVKGLLLLEKETLHRLCREWVTLEQYLSEGGKAILNAAFDTRLVLEPFAQLRLLSRILSMDSEIESGFLNLRGVPPSL